MRYHAGKTGFSLSDRHLYRVNRESKTIIPCGSEKDVFDRLGLEYKSPNERNCFSTEFLEMDQLGAEFQARMDFMEAEDVD